MVTVPLGSHRNPLGDSHKSLFLSGFLRTGRSILSLERVSEALFFPHLAVAGVTFWFQQHPGAVENKPPLREPCSGRTAWAHSGKNVWAKGDVTVPLYVPSATGPRALRGSLRAGMGSWLQHSLAASPSLSQLLPASPSRAGFPAFLRLWELRALCHHILQKTCGAMPSAETPCPPSIGAAQATSVLRNLLVGLAFVLKLPLEHS